MYTLIILPKFLVYYFQCKYVVSYRFSISKSILIVPHTFFNIWFNFSQYYIQQNYISRISQCCSPVILTPISVSFVYRNCYCLINKNVFIYLKLPSTCRYVMFDVINLPFSIRFRDCTINTTATLSDEENQKIATRAVHGLKENR